MLAGLFLLKWIILYFLASNATTLVENSEKEVHYKGLSYELLGSYNYTLYCHDHLPMYKDDPELDEAINVVMRSWPGRTIGVRPFQQSTCAFPFWCETALARPRLDFRVQSTSYSGLRTGPIRLENELGLRWEEDVTSDGWTFPLVTWDVIVIDSSNSNTSISSQQCVNGEPVYGDSDPTGALPLNKEASRWLHYNLAVGPISGFSTQALRLISFDNASIVECFSIEQWQTMQIFFLSFENTDHESEDRAEHDRTLLADQLGVDPL
uniref:Uncharacterized protein n=1 Tax=Ditylenchus dipsaci TaxID=166011 RepID=A0A915CZ57_9BILA